VARKNKKKKGLRPKKVDQQIPISRIRPIQLFGPRTFLQHARDYPISGCWVQEGWKETGLTPVVVARRQAPDKVLFCVCLVDTLCLGVKDAFANGDFPQKKFEKELQRICGGAPEECSPELAHEIVYGAIEFAARFGFQPHPDFTRQMADLVLDPPGTSRLRNKVEFGRKGKPLYVAGPNDDERKINQTLNTLERTAGKGKFDYIVGFSALDSKN
jgi:hypothetical protein